MSRSKWDLADGTEDLTNDGSLLKTILVEGDGDTAGRGAKVSLKYSLRLSDERNAELIDSSSRRKDGVLVFTLGKRKVIPALELVAHSMKLGEKCRIKAAAPYAFGSKGLKRKGVPPNATVYMDVELVHFEHGEEKKPFAEMTPAERFEVAKKRKEEGNALFKELKYDRAMAQYSECIQCLAKVFYNDNTQFGQNVRSDQVQQNGHSQDSNSPDAGNEEGSKSEQPSEPKEEGFEEAQITESSEQNANGVLSSNAPDPQQPISSTHPMSQATNEGEQVEMLDVSTASQEGADSSASVPNSNENGTSEPNSEQHLSTNGNGADARVDSMTAQQSEQQTEPKSEAEDGSKATKHVEDQSASSNAMDNNGGPSPPEKEDENGNEEDGNKEDGTEGPTKAEVSALHVTTLNNLSLCLLKLEQFKKAVESSSLALRADPTSFKAFYYRGRALVALGEWDKAREDLMAAFNLQRNNMGIRMEIQKLDKKRKQFEEKEKKQAAAMFA